MGGQTPGGRGGAIPLAKQSAALSLTYRTGFVWPESKAARRSSLREMLVDGMFKKLFRDHPHTSLLGFTASQSTDFPLIQRRKELFNKFDVNYIIMSSDSSYIPERSPSPIRDRHTFKSVNTAVTVQEKGVQRSSLAQILDSLPLQSVVYLTVLHCLSPIRPDELRWRMCFCHRRCGL
jgi:hypothetical protein